MQGGPLSAKRGGRPAWGQLGGDHQVIQRLILQQIRALLMSLLLRRPLNLNTHFHSNT